MKNILPKTYIFIILSVFSLEIFAQWQPSLGLEGGYTYNIIQSDSLLLTTCDYNIYRTSDDFISEWNKCPGNIRGAALHGVDSCIISYGNTGLKRSFNNGDTWENVPGYGETWAMCSVGSTVFFDYSNLLLKSNNYLDSIESIAMFPEITLMKLYSNDSIMIVLDYFLDAIYQSNDTANSWDTLTLSGLPTSYRSTYDIIYYNNTIWISGNFGIYCLNETKTNWSEVVSGLPIDELVYDMEEYDSDLYCSVRNSGLFRYSDNDSTWLHIDNSPSDIKGINEFNNVLYCGTESGPKMMDSLGNWQKNYEGLYHRDVTSLSYINDSIYVYASNELFISLNEGGSFSKINDVFGSQIIATDSALYSLSSTDILKSSDFGFSWDSINTDILGSLGRMAMNDYYYYVSTSSGLYRSRVDTIFWTLLDNGISTWSYSLGFEVIDSVIIVNDYHLNLISISRDFGGSFDTLFVTNGEFFHIRKDDCRFYIFEYNDILYSDDLGITWNEIDYYKAWSIDQNEDYLVVSSSNGPFEYINISYDNGSSWHDIKDNLPSTIYGSLENITFYNQRLFTSSTKNSLWYRDDILTSIFNSNKEGNNLSTIKPFPNPTSDNITIKLPTDLNEAKYNVYDIRGRLFLSGSISEKYNIIDIKKLNSGIYIIEIFTINNRISKKIIKVD